MLKSSHLRPAGLLAAVVVLLAGCVAPKEQVTPGGTSTQVGPGQDVEALYAQDVDWTSCGSLECGLVLTPVDWDDPMAGTIEIAVSRRPASGPADQRVGSLVINPGGPGSSGIEFLSYAVGTFGRPLLDAFDVVGFDPRGVGESSAVDCGPDDVVDDFLTTDTVIETEEDLAAARERLRAFGEGCLAATGELLGEVDTVSSARDLDLLRAVLGDEKLHYAGFSYGTFLGATYAELFPENVGRLLLDGAMDPSLSVEDLVLEQAAGFEQALRAYVTDCQAVAQCPLAGSVDDGVAQVGAIIDRAERQPFDAGDGEHVNGIMASYGVSVTLYDNGAWPLLTEALREVVEQNTASILLELANFYLDRTPDGAYTTNSMIAFTAINCVDYPAQEYTFAELQALAERAAVEAPTFGPDFVMEPGCEAWPVPPTGERRELHAAGAPPILVVGTTGDPATPYGWSVRLAEQLASGVLLTYEGDGHTAYGRANACVSAAVEGYLVEGQVPEDGLTC